LVAYGSHGTEIKDSDSGADPGVPSVSYGLIRLGLDGIVPLGDLAIEPSVAYLLLTGVGELGEDEWFGNAGGSGIDAELGLTYALSELFALRVAVGYTRYGLALDPDPADDSVLNDGRVAGGALDEYMHGEAGIALSL
jgi:hypothetical protein